MDEHPYNDLPEDSGRHPGIHPMRYDKLYMGPKSQPVEVLHVVGSMEGIFVLFRLQGRSEWLSLPDWRSWWAGQPTERRNEGLGP